ncbi:copper amine oxidase N-terminal domain-containing protein [Peptococcus simiae]|uniref:copper amine oxidase N-terminal domain-containing protein n=1 Tax=Peptococcus simiae TaxID=1643805 RepID=UPI00397F8D30
MNIRSVKKIVKKQISAVLCTALVAGSLLAASPAQAEEPVQTGTAVTLLMGKTEAQLNGNRLTLPKAPRVSAGRTFIPLRATAEAFGFKVDYDAATRIITVSQKDQTLVMTVDMTYYHKNGQVAFMDVAPYVSEDGHTMVPVRFITEAMGFSVEASRNGQDRIVQITR